MSVGAKRSASVRCAASVSSPSERNSTVAAPGSGGPANDGRDVSSSKAGTNQTSGERRPSTRKSELWANGDDEPWCYVSADKDNRSLDRRTSTNIESSALSTRARKGANPPALAHARMS